MPRFRAENVRYLRPLWLRLAVAYAIIIAAFAIVAVLPNPTWGLGPVLIGVAAGLGVVAYRRLQAVRRGKRATQQSSADAAARIMYEPYLSLPNRAVIPVVVSGTAQLHALYGNFERAEELLGSLDWDKQPPFLRGDQLFVRAMIAYVKGDYAAGLSLAETLPDLMEVPRLAPGGKRLRRSIAMLLDLGRMLARDDRDAARRLADEHLAKVLRLQRGIVNWALAKAHERWGESDEAQRYLAQSRDILPYAYGLGVARPPERARGAGVLDPANPYAAPITDAVDAPFEVKQQSGYWRRRFALTVGLWVAATALAYIYFQYFEG